MVETGRIRVAKDKAELVKALTSVEGATGPFPTYADVIVFAAALGAKHKKRVLWEKFLRENRRQFHKKNL